MFARRILVIAASLVLSTFVTHTAHGKASTGHPKRTAQFAKLSSEDRALALVEKVKEVQTWEKTFGPKGFNPGTQGRPGFSVEEHHGSMYVVNVFEDMPEHNVTFARYEVNLKTGSVKKLD